MNVAVAQLYAPSLITLAKGDDEAQEEFDSGIFEQAAEWVRDNGGFTPKMLKGKPAQKVIKETARVIQSAISSSISHETPATMQAALENNAFIFSGFKTYHSLNEVGLKLTDDNGNAKSYGEFKKDVLAIDEKYNQNYLRAEYGHAVQSSQMASKWNDFEQDGERYNLQYRTAGDDKVRADHAVLHDITLPVNDPFWNEFMPPNGWGCRCNVVQVRKQSFPESDSAKAIEAGEMATSAPKEKMFRYNPGKSLEVFPPKHPYYKVSKEVSNVIELITKDVTTTKDLENEIKELAKTNDWFERGFKKLSISNRRGVNGSTDSNGTISLSLDRMEHCISALNKLNKGRDVTFKEADALSTLWHEITHNRSKHGSANLTIRQRKFMELSNEFVARKTLPEFYDAMGRDVQHHALMNNRKSTGYNEMVNNYQKLIALTKADPNKVLKEVKTTLFNSAPNQQEAGLVNSIVNNQTKKRKNGKMLSKKEVGNLLRQCLNRDKSGFVSEFNKLFVEE